MTPEPSDDAPPRTDLPYLRHRGLNRFAARPPAVGAAPPASPITNLLDLSRGPSIPPAASVRHHRREPCRRPAPQRPLALTSELPTAVLSRIQSGIGTLTVRARWSLPAAGWLIVAHESADGEIGLITPRDGPLADTGHLRVDHRGNDPVLTVDLLRVRRIARMLLATTANGSPRELSGALTFATHGGAEVDLPIALPPDQGSVVLATIYNVDGELVLRAERDPVSASLREACEAYGYDRLTWLDSNTPLR